VIKKSLVSAVTLRFELDERWDDPALMSEVSTVGGRPLEESS
jgi:hypothetical protein